MKRLLIGIVVLVALGIVAWGAVSITTQTATTRWLEARQAEGWVANADNVAVSGFPLAFETRFGALELADPATGLAWTAPEFRLEQAAFRLDRLAAIWPGTQTLASPEERLTITSTEIAAELDVQPTRRFALDDMRARLRDVAIQSTADWTMSLETGTLIVTRLDGEEGRYSIELTAANLIPPDAWRDRLDPAGLLPEAMGSTLAQAVIRFDAPWDMDAIEVARPQITLIELEEVNADWGDMFFRATGVLTVREGGVPEGDLAVRAENWRAMVDLAENAGLVPERLRPTAEAMLQVLAGMNGSAENIDATLSFSNGRVFIGPLPLGPAPNLRLR